MNKNKESKQSKRILKKNDVRVEKVIGAVVTCDSTQQDKTLSRLTSLCLQTWAETLEEWGERCLHATPGHCCHSCRCDLGPHRCYSSRMRTCCCRQWPHPSTSSLCRRVTPTNHICFVTALKNSTRTWWTAHSGWTLSSDLPAEPDSPQCTSRHVSKNLSADNLSPEFCFYCRDCWLPRQHQPCHVTKHTELEPRLLLRQDWWRHL